MTRTGLYYISAMSNAAALFLETCVMLQHAAMINAACVKGLHCVFNRMAHLGGTWTW